MVNFLIDVKRGPITSTKYQTFIGDVNNLFINKKYCTRSTSRVGC